MAPSQLRPKFIRARDIVTSCFNKAANPFPENQENDCARVEANNLLEENESPVQM